MTSHVTDKPSTSVVVTASYIENISTVLFFKLCGLEETWMNKSLYFPLTLVTYLLIITLNLTLIITIIMEKSLHEPMYIFLCNLCINSLNGTVGFYPMFLKELLSDIHEISYSACFLQAYGMSTFAMYEITILSVMAFDRYVAICRPLHYHMLMSPLNVGIWLLFAWLYPLLMTITSLSLTLRLPLCGSNIYKIFCDFPSILSHSCVPITVYRIWGYMPIIFQTFLVILIIFSYFQITRVCLSSAEGRMKFTQTCVPHLLAMIIFIVVSLFDDIYGRYEGNLPIYVHNAIAVQFLVTPPVFNPLIYGLNLKVIQGVLFSKVRKIHVLVDR